MNTTDYFTNINAMFLFCIFICLLLLAVGWQLVRKADKLKKEQDSHLKATNTNALLNKALSAKNAALQANEHKLREAEKEIRELQAKLDHAEADRIGLWAERTTLENKLTDALAKVRKRDKDGKFLPSGNARVRTTKKVTRDPKTGRMVSTKAKPRPTAKEMEKGLAAFDAMMGNAIDQLNALTVRKLCDEVKQNAGSGI